MERTRLSREIIETCLEMTRLGLNQGTAGNVSTRFEKRHVDYSQRYSL
ncbi:L-fuculose phosphate aldolase [Escherichia coli]|uniref:L-fuculose phosphate aldolase n=1 Tax=Escherichia coli TaxID=562 RepID=A0A377CV95_ECOLX|nr:L-fuculose phosphate aldolase [Escherichia coli]